MSGAAVRLGQMTPPAVLPTPTALNFGGMDWLRSVWEVQFAFLQMIVWAYGPSIVRYDDGVVIIHIEKLCGDHLFSYQTSKGPLSMIVKHVP